MGHLTWLFLLFGFLIGSFGCSKETPTPKSNEIDGQGMGTDYGKLVRKLEYQKIQAKNWTGEVWVEGTLIGSGRTIFVTHRLTAPDKTEKLPTTSVLLELISDRDGKLVRTLEIQPEFKDCSSIGEHREIIGGGDGKTTPFPQREGSWQASLPFPTTDPSIPVEPGIYWVRVRVNLEGGPSFTFKGMRQEVTKNLKGH